MINKAVAEREAQLRIDFDSILMEKLSGQKEHGYICIYKIRLNF